MIYEVLKSKGRRHLEKGRHGRLPNGTKVFVSARPMPGYERVFVGDGPAIMDWLRDHQSSFPCLKAVRFDQPRVKPVLPPPTKPVSVPLTPMTVSPKRPEFDIRWKWALAFVAAAALGALYYFSL